VDPPRRTRYPDATSVVAVMDDVRRSLRSLCDALTVAELVRDAPRAAAGLGFDRVLLSRVQDSTWIPESAFADCARMKVEEFLAMSRGCRRVLDGSLVETQVVRRREPMLVDIVARRSDLHWDLVAKCRPRCYVVAPIVVGREVAGLLHADRRSRLGRLDVVDREVLWVFSQGLGNLWSQSAATECLDSVRAGVNDLLSDLRHGTGRVWPSTPTTDPAPALVRPTERPRWLSGDSAVEQALSRREMEVLRLVSEGLTNAQIGRRLFIGEGTVKSHVKAILRKLHAAHRAEAVSMWLNGGPASVDPDPIRSGVV